MQKVVKLTLLAAMLACSYASAVPESQLSTQYNNQITPFWQNHVTEGQLKSKDGLTLAYAYTIPEHAKATILLVQGRTEAYIKYPEVFYDLSQRGYAVFMLDHRGQGLSDRLLGDPHKGHVEVFQQYADDQLLFLADVVQKQQQGKLVLLAHSMGGAIAVQLLAQNPNLFSGAVLSSPMIAPNTEVLFSERDGCGLETALGWICSDCYAGFVSQPYVNQDFADNILMTSQARYQQFRQVFAQTPKAQLGGPTWQWVNQACEVSQRMPRFASQIKVPVLMLQAGNEKAVSNNAQQQFCHDLGPNCQDGQVHSFAGASHELLFERDEYRDKVLQLIDQFIERR